MPTQIKPKPCLKRLSALLLLALNASAQAASITGLTIDTVIPRIDVSTSRLPSGQTVSDSLQMLFNLVAPSWRVLAQDDLGTVRATRPNGDKVAGIPLATLLVDPDSANGAQCYGNGLCQTIASNLITRFNAALDDPQAFVTALRKADPAATLRLNGEGNLQASLHGRRYVGQVGWHILPAAGLNGFASDSSGGLWFAGSTGKQALTPALANFDRLQTLLKQVDATGTALGDHQGGVVVVLKGQTFRLKPQWEVINTPTAHAKEDYWVEGGVVYLNYLDGTAQGVTVP